MLKIITLDGQKKTEILVLSFFLLLNFATTGGHQYSIDDTKYFLITENIVVNQSFMLDPNSPSLDVIYNGEGEKTFTDFQFLKYVNEEGIIGKGERSGHAKSVWMEKNPIVAFYFEAPPLLPILAVPLYYLATITSSNPIPILMFFTNTIILSLTSLMIFKFGLHYFRSNKIAFVLSLVFLVTTFVWPLNTGMMLRPLASLMVILGVYFVETSNAESRFKIVIAGLCIGFSLLAHVAALILLPILIAYGIYKLRKNKKQVALLLISFFVVMMIQAYTNEARFGSVTDFGFGLGQDISNNKYLRGVWIYLIGLDGAVPIYAPLLIMIPLALYIAWKKNRSFVLLVTICFAITYLFHGTQWAWGLGGWGARYFTIILPLLIIPLGFVIQKYAQSNIFRISFVSLAVFGFFSAIVGKLVWWVYAYYIFGGSFLLHEKIDSTARGLLQNYNLEYSKITLHLGFLNTDFIQNFQHGYFGGLAPCVYDLYIYCELGVILFIITLGALSVISYILLRSLFNQEESIRMIRSD